MRFSVKITKKGGYQIRKRKNGKFEGKLTGKDSFTLSSKEIGGEQYGYIIPRTYLSDNLIEELRNEESNI